MSDKVKLFLEDAFFIIDEKIKNGGEITFSPKGVSMLPLIRPGLDSVVLKKADGTLKKGDIAFYRRDNGKFVLHRVIKVKTGFYRMCGDNQIYVEKKVEDRHIIAVVKEVLRDGKAVDFGSFKYKLYLKMLVLKRFGKKLFSTVYIKAVLRRIKFIISK